MIVTRFSLKAYILENISQIELLSKLFEVSEGVITDGLNGKYIHNTIRGERHASVKLKYCIDNKTKLSKIYITDYGDSRYIGDCFAIAGLKFGLNVNNNVDFILICKKLLSLTYTNSLNNTNNIDITIKTLNVINITSRPATRVDYKFAESLGLTLKEFLYFTKGVLVDTAYMSTKKYQNKIIYTHTASDICIAYIIGIHMNIPIIKLYFPFRKKGNSLPKFITNNPFPFDDLSKFKPADILILIKSKKDYAVILKHLFKNKRFLQLQQEYSIVFRVVSSEVPNLSSIQALTLQSLYKYIFLYTDWDNQGCITASYYRRTFGIIPIMLTNGSHSSVDFAETAKDISDYRIIHNETKLINLFDNAITHILYEIARIEKQL